jgi:apolipoprotein N-acyltransferase
MVLTSAVIYQWLEVLLRKPETPTIKQTLKPTLVLAVLFTLNLAYGFWAIDALNEELGQSNERIRIGTVQTNMGIYQKRKDPIEGLKRHRKQSLQLQAQGADLIIWPESGFFRAISSNSKNLKAAVLGPIKTPLLFGGLRTNYSSGKREIYNTAFLTNADGDLLGTYDKTFLLAFGEYLPGGDLFPFLYKLSPNTSHFNRGTHTRPLELKGIKYAVLICYEDILPRFVQKVMTHKPHVLVNITNDAWFGDTHEPTIHLALSIFRTIEHRRYLIRSTNTGISAMIDPTGKITQQTSIFERVNLLESVVPLQNETIYTQFGDWIAYLSGLSLLGMVFIGRKRAQS